MKHMKPYALSRGGCCYPHAASKGCRLAKRMRSERHEILSDLDAVVLLDQVAEQQPVIP